MKFPKSDAAANSCKVNTLANQALSCDGSPPEAFEMASGSFAVVDRAPWLKYVRQPLATINAEAIETKSDCDPNTKGAASTSDGPRKQVPIVL